MTLSPAQIEQRRAAGRSRATAFTPDYQRAISAAQDLQIKKRGGRTAYQTNRQRYGDALMAARLADYRRAHPSDLEQIVIGWLDELGEHYDREIAVGDVFADFIVGYLAVEVDSHYWHRPNLRNRRSGPERDARKDALLRSFGYHVLRLSEAEIRDGSGRARLEAALHNFATEPVYTDEPISF